MQSVFTFDTVLKQRSSTALETGNTWSKLITQLNNDNTTGMRNYFLWLTYCRSVQNLSHWQRSVLQSLDAHMSRASHMLRQGISLDS